MAWLQNRINSLLDNFFFTLVVSGVGTVIALIKELPAWEIALITVGIFVGVFALVPTFERN